MKITFCQILWICNFFFIFDFWRRSIIVLPCSFQMFSFFSGFFSLLQLTNLPSLKFVFCLLLYKRSSPWIINRRKLFYVMIMYLCDIFYLDLSYSNTTCTATSQKINLIIFRQSKKNPFTGVNFKSTKLILISSRNRLSLTNRMAAPVSEEDIMKMRLLIDGDGQGKNILSMHLLI